MNTKKHSILFIDEDEAERDKFQYYARKYERVIVLAIPPPRTIDEIIQLIIQDEIDAVVCDFDLKDRGTSAVTYYGDEVIEQILEVKPGFPVFVFTSHEPDALEHDKSVHYVYDKELMNEPEKTFLKKIEIEISKYYTQIDDWKKEFASLRIKKLKNKITTKDEEKLIELDSILEKTINQKTSIASQVKQEQKEKMKVFIKKTDEILEEIKTKLGKK